VFNGLTKIKNAQFHKAVKKSFVLRVSQHLTIVQMKGLSTKVILAMACILAAGLQVYDACPRIDGSHDRWQLCSGSCRSAKNPSACTNNCLENCFSD